VINDTVRQLSAPLILTNASPDAGAPDLAGPELLASLGFKAKLGELVRLPASAVNGPFAGQVLGLVGLGPEPDAAAWRNAFGSALRQVGKALTVVLAPTWPPEQTFEEVQRLVAAATEGALLGADDAVDLVLCLPPVPADPAGEPGSAVSGRGAVAPGSTPGVGAPGSAAQLLTGLEPFTALARRAEVLAEAVKQTRRLVNQPPNQLYPESLAEEAAQRATAAGLTVAVLGQEALAEGGFGGLLAVGQGSVRPPRLVAVTYSPADARSHVGLVGKGITFDSGGLSLKQPGQMATMKSDMAGAATVLETTLAAARLELPVKISALLCLAENMPSGTAARPSDVITLKDGQTVEITNTDAEGRLVLADGIAAARQAGVDLVIDIATLTGAQVIALGNRIAGVMGTSELRDGIIQAAKRAGEPAWAMPLPPELVEVFKSDVADLTNANLSERAAGMLSAGVFLQQFVGQTPWAHIDMAGPAYNAGQPHGYTPKGGTGYGVATLLAYLEDLAAA
jgi:leucyl aminopeptidase